MSTLFSPLKFRQTEFKNRIFVSPMCQYCGESGMPGDWHFVHLGSRAVGGAALVITEAAQAEQIVSTGQADAVFLAREFLRDPYWPLHAARTLGVDISWPKQYQRAKK